MKRLLGVALLCALGCSRAVTPPIEVTHTSPLPKLRTLAVVPAVAAPNAAGDAIGRAPLWGARRSR